MLKDKDTIINEMMVNAACVIENKIAFTEIVLEQFVEKGESAKVQALTADIEDMRQALGAITKRAGSWA